MANETALERILRVLNESEEVEPELKPALEEGLLLLENTPTPAGFQKIVERSEAE